jgi:hypothetical protein
MKAVVTRVIVSHFGEVKARQNIAHQTTGRGIVGEQPCNLGEKGAQPYSPANKA